MTSGVWLAIRDNDGGGGGGGSSVVMSWPTLFSQQQRSFIFRQNMHTVASVTSLVEHWPEQHTA